MSAQAADALIAAVRSLVDDRPVAGLRLFERNQQTRMPKRAGRSA